MMLFKRTLPALLLAVLAACGGADSGDSPENAEGPAIDPATLQACQLFTVEDALSLNGGKRVSTMASTLEEATTRNNLVCTYNAGSRARPRLIGLDIRPAKSAKAAARQLENSRSFLKRLAGGEIQEVPGVGDKAVWAGGELHQLHVLHGNLLLVISAQTDNPARSLYIAKLGARRVLQRLQGAPGEPGEQQGQPS